MLRIDKLIYTARTRTTGGREGGTSRSDDGRLNVKLSAAGGPLAGTNPEQLFAAGWSACFLASIKLAAAKKKVALPDELAVDAEVDLGMANDAYALAARLHVSLPGVERTVAEELVDAAHCMCPYSNATRGNIEVIIDVL